MIHPCRGGGIFIEAAVSRRADCGADDPRSLVRAIRDARRRKAARIGDVGLRIVRGELRRKGPRGAGRSQVADADGGAGRGAGTGGGGRSEAASGRRGARAPGRSGATASAGLRRLGQPLDLGPGAARPGLSRVLGPAARRGTGPRHALAEVGRASASGRRRSAPGLPELELRRPDEARGGRKTPFSRRWPRRGARSGGDPPGQGQGRRAPHPLRRHRGHPGPSRRDRPRRRPRRPSGAHVRSGGPAYAGPAGVTPPPPPRPRRTRSSACGGSCAATRSPIGSSDPASASPTAAAGRATGSSDGRGAS